MTYKNDLKEIASEYKEVYKKLKIGLIDPRGSEVDSVLKFLDFLIVDSLEMKDFLASTNYQFFIITNIQIFLLKMQTKISLKKQS